jgi:hypothetical protein
MGMVRATGARQYAQVLRLHLDAGLRLVADGMPASFTGRYKPTASAFQAGAPSDSGFVKSTHKIALPNQQT